MLMSLPTLHVNHPSREADACYKPFQLTTAARCGLGVPDTLVTNRPQAVRHFARDLNNQVVVKVMGE